MELGERELWGLVVKNLKSVIVKLNQKVTMMMKMKG